MVYWHCGWTCGQLTSGVDGGVAGGRLGWSVLTWCVALRSGGRVSASLSDGGLCWAVFARNRDTVVPAEGNGDFQTLICVLVVRPRRCLTLTNPDPWRDWMAACLGCALRMGALFRGWPVMVHDTITRRRRRMFYWSFRSLVSILNCLLLGLVVDLKETD